MFDKSTLSILLSGLILILLGILIVLLAGSTTGYLLAWPKSEQPSQSSITPSVAEEKSQRPKSAQEDAIFADRVVELYIWSPDKALEK